MKRELLMTKKANQLAGKGTNLLSYLLPFLSTGGWTFPSGRGMARGGQGPREDEVPAIEQTLLPNLKILISVVGSP